MSKNATISVTHYVNGPFFHWDDHRKVLRADLKSMGKWYHKIPKE